VDGRHPKRQVPRPDRCGERRTAAFCTVAVGATRSTLLLWLAVDLKQKSGSPSGSAMTWLLVCDWGSLADCAWGAIAVLRFVQTKIALVRGVGSRPVVGAINRLLVEPTGAAVMPGVLPTATQRTRHAVGGGLWASASAGSARPGARARGTSSRLRRRRGS
jgi:hypothetical protein